MNEQQHSAAWQQFLIGRQRVLADYDRARSHARTQPVQTHHGNVAEAAFRDWLATFLPKKFGVTSGYIRSQGFTDVHQSGHLDVIIYDQMEAPTLWVEDNRDISSAGQARIIPVENVGAVLEVKAAFTRRSVTDATNKLTALAPLMEQTDAEDERYPRYLPPSTVLAIVCLELREEDRSDQTSLDIIRDLSVGRFFYGTVILRGDGRSSADTALIRQTESDQPHEATFTDAGLHGTAMAPTTELDGRHRSALMMWSDVNFSMFAFDLLAILKGSYRAGYISSLHGVDLTSLRKD